MPTGGAPFELDWRIYPEAVQDGESFTLAVRMQNVRLGGEHGGISISFPLLTETGVPGGRYSSAVADVEAISYTTGLSRVTLYSPGETIYHRDNNRMFPAENLLVESDDPLWSKSDDRTVILEITPKVEGEFPIWIRGWICAKEYTRCTRDPVEREVTDQQGYGVNVATVGVGDDDE